MATQNAIDMPLTIEVSNGGTGASSLTDYGVLIGSGTGTITALSVGATGELFVGAVTADPSFADSATGDFTFTGAVSASDRILTIENTDNSDTASGSVLYLQVGGTSAGDPWIKYTVSGVLTKSFGVDNSDSDKFKMSNSGYIGTSDTLVATTDGEITKPLQPSFLAYPSADINNVTGDGTVYTVIWNTEAFDQGSDYNTSTGVFTAPVTGRYFFSGMCYMTSAGASTTDILTSISTSNRNYLNGHADTTDDSYMRSLVTATADMDASDTAVFKVTVSGNGSAISDVLGLSGGVLASSFSGYLVC